MDSEWRYFAVTFQAEVENPETKIINKGMELFPDGQCCATLELVSKSKVSGHYSFPAMGYISDFNLINHIKEWFSNSEKRSLKDSSITIIYHCEITKDQYLADSKK